SQPASVWLYPALTVTALLPAVNTGRAGAAGGATYADRGPVVTLAPTVIWLAPSSPAIVRSRSVMTGASSTSPTPARESAPAVNEFVAPAATPRCPPMTLLRSPMLTERAASRANWVTGGTGTVSAAAAPSPSG